MACYGSNDERVMAHRARHAMPQPLLRGLDPRRSLAAGAAWLIIGLAFAFAIAAALWVGRVARQNVLEQHVRRLALETDQRSAALAESGQLANPAEYVQRLNRLLIRLAGAPSAA